MPKGRTKDSLPKTLAPIADSSDKPRCPDYLTDEARKEFFRLVRELDSLTAKDSSSLALYCKAFARWRTAEDRLDEDGYTQDYKGFERQSPWVQISNEAQKSMRELQKELGMTPASRKKLSQADAPRQADKFDKFVAKRSSATS